MQAYETEETPTDMVRWEGVLWMEGTASVDGRVIREGAVGWALPAPLQDVSADTAPELVGMIDEITSGDVRGQVLAAGTIRADRLPEGEERDVGVDIVVFEQSTDGHMTVEEGRLIGATLSSGGSAWPECKIRRVSS